MKSKIMVVFPGEKKGRNETRSIQFRNFPIPVNRKKFKKVQFKKSLKKIEVKRVKKTNKYF